MFTVYIIYSDKFDRYYTGMTSDPIGRLTAHNAGSVKSTKPYKPWKYVHEEIFPERIEARKREKYLKSAPQAEFSLNRLM